MSHSMKHLLRQKKKEIYLKFWQHNRSIYDNGMLSFTLMIIETTIKHLIKVFLLQNIENTVTKPVSNRVIVEASNWANLYQDCFFSSTAFSSLKMNLHLMNGKRLLINSLWLEMRHSENYWLENQLAHYINVSFWGQLYQYIMSSFCAKRFRVIWGQFHQHITCSFCSDIFAPKSTNLKSKYKKASRETFVRKNLAYNVGEIDTWLTSMSIWR
jgi:hypothetical protein